MQTLVIVFIVIVGVMVVLSAVVFGVIFFTTARFTGKIFRHAQRELDRQACASEPPQPVVCDHCGSRVTSAERCSNCGAPLP